MKAQKTAVYYPSKRLEEVFIGPYSIELVQNSYGWSDGTVISWLVEKRRGYKIVAKGVYNDIKTAMQAFDAQKQSAIIDVACEAMRIERPRTGQA